MITILYRELTNLVTDSLKPEDVSHITLLPYGAVTGLFFSMLNMGFKYLNQRHSLVLWLIDGSFMFLYSGYQVSKLQRFV